MRQINENVSAKGNKDRNCYTITQITDAFLALLKEKSFDSISISELTAKAEVGRASFYRNFQRKEDILILYLNKIFQECTTEWSKNDKAPLSLQVKIIIEHFEKYRSFYSLLNQQRLTYLIKDYIITLCGPKPEHNMLEAYASSFAAYSLYGWIDTWFKRGMKETSDEIYEMFHQQGL